MNDRCILQIYTFKSGSRSNWLMPFIVVHPVSLNLMLWRFFFHAPTNKKPLFNRSSFMHQHQFFYFCHYYHIALRTILWFTKILHMWTRFSRQILVKFSNPILQFFSLVCQSFPVYSPVCPYIFFYGIKFLQTKLS